MFLRCYRDGTDPFDGEGWFRTGDSGRLDMAGRLAVDGRLSDLIITGGENVWPSAVEAALGSHPGVAEVTVASRSDPEWGQKVVAWVVPVEPSDPPSLPALREIVAERIAPFAAPRELIIVATLPHTSIGKVSRDRLPELPAP